MFMNMMKELNAFKRLFKHKKITLNYVTTILNNFKFYTRYIKEKDKQEIYLLKDKFEKFYFPTKEIKLIDAFRK